MFEVTCPLCGKPVPAEQVGRRARLFCKKCHTPFYLDKAGVAVVGEPPGDDDEVEALKQKVRQTVERVPVRRVVALLAAVLVVGTVLFYVFRPAQRLDEAAEWAARAFADDDARYLKSIAAPGTEEDVARWFDEHHSQLVRERARWSGKAVIDVHVAQEDRAGRKGSAAISIHSGLPAGLDVSLADPSVAGGPAAVPIDLDTAWTLSWWGRWRLDGRETYAKTHPRP